MGIYYETGIGIIFEDKLKISDDGIEWQGHITPLDKITGISWGIITRIGKVSSNNCLIAFEDSDNRISWIRTKRKAQYEEITKHLWLALATSISFKMINQIQKGDTLHIGSIKFNDNGVYLRKWGLFSEKFFYWKEPLVIINNNGNLIISASNVRYSASASYIHDMNTHIFEAIMRKFFNNFNYKNPRITSLLSL